MSAAAGNAVDATRVKGDMVVEAVMEIMNALILVIGRIGALDFTCAFYKVDVCR